MAKLFGFGYELIVVICSFGLMAGCGKKRSESGEFCNPEYFDSDGKGGCIEKMEPISQVMGPQINWDAENPTFEASLKIVNIEGNPIKNARIDIGGVVRTTGGDGVAKWGGLSAKTSSIAHIKADGFAPISRSVNLANAAGEGLTISLLPLSEGSQISGETGGLTTGSNAGVWFPGEAFLKPSGEPHKEDVIVKMATIDPAIDDENTGPGELVGATQSGDVVGLESGGMIYAKIEDSSGNELKLASDQHARVLFRLPANFAAKAGDELPLWAFNNEDNQWQEESTCLVKVASEPNEDGSEALECEGTVAHFSWWNLDIRARDACVNITFHGNFPKRYKLLSSTHQILTERCARGTCRWVVGGAAASAIVPPSSSGDGSFCAIVRLPPRGEVPSHKLRTIIRVKDLSAENKTQTFVQEDLLPSLITAASEGNVWKFRGDSNRLCTNKVAGKTCLQHSIELVIGEPMEDADGDGYPAHKEGISMSRKDVDCDDNNPNIHPGAQEDPCNNIDDNCDGRRDPSPLSWSYRCVYSCGAPNTEEIPGNSVDEDCNGIATDRDDDGYVARYDRYSAPGYKSGDCNDWDKRVHPGAEEIWGNARDENCDGMALDYDGDNFLSTYHLRRISKNELGNLSEEQQTLVDCNDYRQAINPKADVVQEASFKSFYQKNEQDGTTYRTAAFCNYFDSRGQLNWRGRMLLRDVNCDGFYSDLDGDGWTIPGDNFYGPERAWDCNDLDPRIHPVEESTNGLPPACVAEEKMVNNRTCEVDLGKFGGGETKDRLFCPAIPGKGPTYCDDLLDGEGGEPTGYFVCRPLDWKFENPLKPFAFGEVWGPCDFNKGPIEPNCQGQTYCGGPQSWSNDYLDRLLTEFNYDMENVYWKGMCFPRCGDRCNPNPCRAPNKNVCTLENRNPKCSCNPGFEPDGDNCVESQE